LYVAPFIAGQHADDPTLPLLAQALRYFGAARAGTPAGSGLGGPGAASSRARPGAAASSEDLQRAHITEFFGQLRAEAAAHGLSPRTGRPVDATVAVFGAVLHRLREERTPQLHDGREGAKPQQQRAA
jgi:hypothetical protein